MEIAWLTIPKIIAAVVIGVILAICIANPVQYVSHPAQPVAVVTPVPTPQPVYIKPTPAPVYTGNYIVVGAGGGGGASVAPSPDTIEPTPTLMSTSEMYKDLFPAPLWLWVLFIVIFMFIFSVVSGNSGRGIVVFGSIVLLLLSFLGVVDFGIYTWVLYAMFIFGMVWMIREKTLIYD